MEKIKTKIKMDKILNVQIKSKSRNLKSDKKLTFTTDFTKEYNLKTADEMKNFDKITQELRKEQSILNSETEYFSRFYRKLEDKKLQDAQKRLDKGDPVEKTFSHLIISYKDKGFKIPDLSVNKNLFKASPLLLENSKVNDYYRMYNTSRYIEEDRALHFVDKLQGLVGDKIMQINTNESNEIKLLGKTVSLAKKKKDSKKIKLPQYMNEEEYRLRRENRKLELENEKFKATVEDMRIKKLHKSLKKNNNEKSYSKSKFHVPAKPSFSESVVTNASSKKKQLESININKAKLKNFNSLYLINYTDPASDPLNDDSLEMKMNYETISHLETAGETKQSEEFSPIRATSPTKAILRTKSCHSSKTKNDKKVVIEVPEKQTFKSIEKVMLTEVSGKKSFLENLEKLELDKMSVKELKKYVAFYCRNYLNYTNEQIDEKISKPLEPVVIWNMITETKKKVDKVDVKESVQYLYKLNDHERKHKLEKVRELDASIKEMKFVLMRTMNGVNKK